MNKRGSAGQRETPERLVPAETYLRGKRGWLIALALASAFASLALIEAIIAIG